MAYCAVVSAKQKLERLLLHRPISGIFLPIPELKSVWDELCHLGSFLLQRIDSSWSSKLRADGLETQIQDVADKLEDAIDSHVSARFLCESGDGSNHSLNFSQELTKVKQEISSLMERLKYEEQHSTEEDEQPDDAVSPRIYYPDGNNEMVGLDERVGKVILLLVEDRRSLLVTSVVGMAGIGKTALVKRLLDHSLCKELYDTTFVITIGPKFRLRKFLLLILEHMGFDVDEMHNKDAETLAEHLHKSLKGRRYLIVLDDVWNTQVWDEIRPFFPNEKYCSRIILTTRLLEVARHAITTKNFYQVPFLNEEESWNLLRKRVFTGNEELCTFQLEKLGRKIAEKCQGLPLAIIVVGDRLREAEKTVEYWKSVVEDEDSPIMRVTDEPAIFQSLSLSYEMLPQHLRPMFLYMGVFPQNYEIHGSELIQLWVSEGFIGQEKGESLEHMAKVYLDNLISESVVLHGDRSSAGGVKTCRVHFVFRDLCVSVAQNDKFFCVLKKYDNSLQQRTNHQQRLCIHNNVLFGIKDVHSSVGLASTARSLLCYGPRHQHPLRVFLHFRLLRVLNALTVRFYEFPDQVLKLVRLRYLAITYDGEVPKSISRLWNLELLILGRYQNIKSSNAPAYLPMEIWKLQWLRHLHCTGRDLPDPSTGCGNDSDLVLKNILTLSGVSARSCTRGVLERMPNLVKLGIRIESPQEAVETFSFFSEVAQHLPCLESFKCIVANPRPGISSIPAFPAHNLKKLTLSGCGFSWKDMAAIGTLPNLQVLKLRCHAFRGPVWEKKTDDDKFPELKFLLLEDLDIEFLRYKYFWRLRRLIIRHCYKLQKIPLEVGTLSFFISSLERLKLLELVDCSSSLVSWAKKIHDKPSFANRIEVRIHSSWDDHQNFRSKSSW